MKLENFIHDLGSMQSADFHWGIRIEISEMGYGIGYDYEIIMGTKVLQGGELISSFDGMVAVIVGRAYECAIATKNGGDFGYKPGMQHFCDWVTAMVDGADASSLVLPDPHDLWMKYRAAMKERHGRG